VVVLSGDRVTIGKAAENGIALDGDPTVSRLHAVLERFDAGWCVSDLGSANGTFVNGERIWSSQRLRHGDEVRVGRTRCAWAAPACCSATAPTSASPSRRPRRARRR
jgi:pSer/pThr/pTyr-binding forkhead associated (FHA) protein